jgi:EAL domain-containing protein (putative c-di-GMP-specific phosphodiesterase class I)
MTLSARDLFVDINRMLSGEQSLLLMYQPIVDSTSQTTPHFEVLARMLGPNGVLPPSVFFPIIKLQRLEEKFDLALLRVLDQELTGHLDFSGRGLAFNLSVPGLHSKTVLSAVRRLCLKHPDISFILEVPEAGFIPNLGAIGQNLAELRKYHGVRIALDDFGSEYSSLAYLTELPIDILKFDKSLIYAMCRPTDRIIRAVVNAARQEGLDLVAEGVETLEQLQEVTSAGFTHIQGYLLGHPTVLPQPGSWPL